MFITNIIPTRRVRISKYNYFLGGGTLGVGRLTSHESMARFFSVSLKFGCPWLLRADPRSSPPKKKTEKIQVAGNLVR